MKDSISRLKYYESNNTFYGHFDTRVIMENHIRELESTNKKHTEEKQELQVAHRILVEKHNDTVKKLTNTDTELNLLQKSMADNVNFLEDKLAKIVKDLETFQGENKFLRKQEEKFKDEKHALETEREKFREKYEKYKSKFAELSERYNEVSF